MTTNVTTTPQQAFGITCPSSSQFYTNSSSKSKFVGCCRNDKLPTDETCPQDSLDAMTFNPLATDPSDIPAQRCVAQDSDIKWYACSSGSLFMGCCASDPCKPGGCQAKDVRAAMLSDDPKAAAAFYNPDSKTLQMAPSSIAPSSTPSSTATAAPDPSNNSSGDSASGLPRAAVAGIALGAAGLLLVVIILVYWCVRRGQKKKNGQHTMRTLRAMSGRRYTGERDQERDGGMAAFRSPLTLPKDIQSSMRMSEVTDSRQAAVVYGRTASFGTSDETIFGTPAPRYTSTMPQRDSMDKSVQHNTLNIVQETASIASIAADQISLHGSIHPALAPEPPFAPPSRGLPDEPPHGYAGSSLHRPSFESRRRPSESSLQPLRSQPTFPYEPALPSPQYSRHDLHAPPPFTAQRPRQNSHPNLPSPSHPVSEDARPSTAPRQARHFIPVTQINSPVLPDTLISPSRIGPLSPHHNLTRELHAKNQTTPLPPPPSAATSAAASSSSPSTAQPTPAPSTMSRKMPGFRRHRKKDQRLSPLMAPHQKLQLSALPLVRSHSKLGFDPMGIRFSLSGRIKPRGGAAAEQQQQLRSPVQQMMQVQEEGSRSDSVASTLQDAHWEAVNRI